MQFGYTQMLIYLKGEFFLTDQEKLGLKDAQPMKMVVFIGQATCVSHEFFS